MLILLRLKSSWKNWFRKLLIVLARVWHCPFSFNFLSLIHQVKTWGECQVKMKIFFGVQTWNSLHISISVFFLFLSKFWFPTRLSSQPQGFELYSQLIIPLWIRNLESPPVYLHLIFEISSVSRFFFNFKISSLKN